MKLDFTQLENHLQTLIEGSTALLFPAVTQRELKQQLLDLLLAGVREDGLVRKSAPNLYILSVHPSFAAELKKQVDILDGLTQFLVDAARTNYLDFLGPPLIQVVEDASLPRQKVVVAAQFHLEHLSQTVDIGYLSLDPSPVPENAFLIIDGMQTYCLERSVVNIGRRPDNQLVIDDPRVSRLHAQLRVVRGYFMIFDLNTTGGTLVNGQRVRQWMLSPGDVISLAGVPLVYGQDVSLTYASQEFASEGLPTSSEPEILE